FDDDTLRHDGAELVVHEVDAVHLAVDERKNRGLRDALRVRELQRLKQVDLLVTDVEAAAREEIAAAPADEPERDLPVRILGDERPGRLDHVRIEAAAQAAVRRDDEEQDAPARARRLPLVEERMRSGL